MDAIVTPVSGGSMLSGICIAAKALKPDIKIFGAEPLNADDCAKSFIKKELILPPGKDYHIKYDNKSLSSSKNMKEKIVEFFGSL